MTLNDLEPQNRGFYLFFLRFAAAEEWIAMQWMEMDQDNLRTGTAIDSRTSHEH